MTFGLKHLKEEKRFIVNFRLSFVVQRRFLHNIQSQLSAVSQKSLKIEDLLHSRYKDQNFYSCLNSDFSEIRLHQGSGISEIFNNKFRY